MLPLNEHGKVDRNALQKMSRSCQEDAIHKHFSGDALCMELARIWNEVLPTSVRSASDDFFELGGRSFAAVELCLEIERMFGVRIDVTGFFSDASFSRLVEILRESVSRDRLGAKSSLAKSHAQPESP